MYSTIHCFNRTINNCITAWRTCRGKSPAGGTASQRWPVPTHRSSESPGYAAACRGSFAGAAACAHGPCPTTASTLVETAARASQPTNKNTVRHHTPAPTVPKGRNIRHQEATDGTPVPPTQCVPVCALRLPSRLRLAWSTTYIRIRGVKPLTALVSEWSSPATRGHSRQQAHHHHHHRHSAGPLPALAAWRHAPPQTSAPYSCAAHTHASLDLNNTPLALLVLVGVAETRPLRTPTRVQTGASSPLLHPLPESKGIDRSRNKLPHPFA